MRKGFELIIIGVDLIVLSILVGYVIYTKNVTGDLVKSNNKSMEEERAEFASGGLESLCVDTLTGTQVISAIRKYKDDYTIHIAAAHTGAVIESYDSNTAFSKHESSVKPENIYSGSLNVNSAGNVAGITFTQQENADDITAVTTVDQAKTIMVDLLNQFGITPTSSWAEIIQKIKDNASLDAKTTLSKAVDGRIAETENINKLATAASDRIKELQNENSKKRAVVNLEVSPNYKASTAADVLDFCKIGFNPSFVIVTQEHSTEMFIKTAAGWISTEQGLVPTTDFDVLQVDGVFYFFNGTANSVLRVTAYE